MKMRAVRYAGAELLACGLFEDDDDGEVDGVLYTQRHVEQLRAAYDAEIAARDAEIARLRKAMVSVKTKRTVRERRRGDEP